MADAALINGRMYDYSSIEIQVDGNAYGLIKSISYSAKREIGKARGNSPVRRGKTRGTYDAEGSLEMYKSGDGGFDQLIANFGDNWMEKEFDVVVSYGNNGEPVTTDTLRVCEFSGDEASPAEGSDAITRKLTLDITGILVNGKQPMRGITL